jgi:hypothetical protein
MRGRVFNLLAQLLLGIARAVTFGPESRRTHDHVLLSGLSLPQPAGPGPRIYIPQEQLGPVIPPGTGFPFRRLLRFAGLRLRNSIPSPHGVLPPTFRDIPLIFIPQKEGAGDRKENCLNVTKLHEHFFVLFLRTAFSECLNLGHRKSFACRGRFAASEISSNSPVVVQ